MCTCLGTCWFLQKCVSMKVGFFYYQSANLLTHFSLTVQIVIRYIHLNPATQTCTWFQKYILHNSKWLQYPPVLFPSSLFPLRQMPVRRRWLWCYQVVVYSRFHSISISDATCQLKHDGHLGGTNKGTGVTFLTWAVHFIVNVGHTQTAVVKLLGFSYWSWPPLSCLEQRHRLSRRTLTVSYTHLTLPTTAEV